LGLEQHDPAFRDNEIDAEVLPGLAGEDLKDLGVTVVGHRRKGRATPSAAPDKPAEAHTAAEPQAARRQLRVMFRDPVGSAAWSAQMAASTALATAARAAMPCFPVFCFLGWLGRCREASTFSPSARHGHRQHEPKRVR
jgi:SAM domain (Sterile alpha motif)